MTYKLRIPVWKQGGLKPPAKRQNLFALSQWFSAAHWNHLRRFLKTADVWVLIPEIQICLIFEYGLHGESHQVIALCSPGSKPGFRPHSKRLPFDD